jgi:hypothetical protein
VASAKSALVVKTSNNIGEAHITRETGEDLSMSYNKKLLTHFIKGGGASSSACWHEVTAPEKDEGKSLC